MPFDPTWKHLLGDAFVDEWRGKVDALYAQEGREVYPQQASVFRAFNECPLDCLKVVIVGQDPYDNGKADGLAFSVPDGVSVPPTLWIIFSKICHDLLIAVQHANGNLTRWARQGVLLLNSSLTIEKVERASDSGAGDGGERPCSISWEDFTGHVLKNLSEKRIGIVFMLWGEAAQKRCEHIVNKNGEHLVLCSSHPSPKSACKTSNPFVRCQHFSQANKWLRALGRTEVDWA